MSDDPDIREMEAPPTDKSWLTTETVREPPGVALVLAIPLFAVFILAAFVLLKVMA